MLKRLSKHLAGHVYSCFYKLDNGIVSLHEFSYIMSCSLYFSLSQDFVIVPYQMRKERCIILQQVFWGIE